MTKIPFGLYWQMDREGHISNRGKLKMKTQLVIVVVGLMSALLVSAAYLERHVKAQGISAQDRAALTRLIDSTR